MGNNESLLLCGDPFDGLMLELLVDGMKKRKAIEEHQVHTDCEVAVVLEDAGQDQSRGSSRYLYRWRSGFVAFNIANIFAIDVLCSLRVINGKGTVLYVPGGKDVFKVDWRGESQWYGIGPWLHPRRQLRGR